MKRTAIFIGAALVVLAPSLVPSLAGASPAVEGEELVTEQAHGGPIEWVTPVVGHEGNTGMLWIFINFAVLLFLLEKLLFRKLRANTATRHDQIKDELQRATKARTEAEGIMREYRKRMEKLDDEVAELQADAKRKAEADRETIIADAKREAERIRAAAKAAAEREAESRRREIENEIVDRAVQRAEAVLRDKMTSGDQTRMVDDYVGRLSNLDLGARPGARS